MFENKVQKQSASDFKAMRISGNSTNLKIEHFLTHECDITYVCVHQCLNSSGLSTYIHNCLSLKK